MIEHGLLEQAETIGAMAAERAASSERNRKLDEEVVRALVESGLLKVLGAERHGGSERGFGTFVRIGRRLANHDVSTAWVYCILGIHHWWGALTEPKLQEELWGTNPDLLFVDSFAPTSNAEPLAGGHRLSGRWSFLSGLPWAEWVAVGAIAPLEAGGRPEYLMLFVPKSEYTVIDDWHTVGLRGSASGSVEISGAIVPRHRIFRMSHVMETGDAPGLAANRGSLFRIPIVPGLGLALVPPSLGGARAVAQRFLDRAKSRVPLFSGTRQAELVLAQTMAAEAMVELDMLEALLDRSAAEIDAIGRERRVVDKAARTRLFAWRAHVPKRCREIIARLVDVAGSRAIFDDDPIQRFWRDVNVMGQHVALNYETGMRNYGRTLLGLEPDATIY